jgi:excisionase family DNA binding protein
MEQPSAGREPLMTPEQVAQQFNVEPKTLAMWRSTRRQPLPFVKLGGMVRYRPEDVDQFIQSRLQAA